MKHSSTLYVGLDVHKESIAVAYVSDAKDAQELYLGSRQRWSGWVFVVFRALHSAWLGPQAPSAPPVGHYRLRG